MQERQITVANFLMFAATRVALGVGIGLLLSGGLNRDQRKSAGIALLSIGAATTVPLAIDVLGRKSRLFSDWTQAA